MSPFARLQNPSFWEITKMCIGLFTLVPLRLLLLLSALILGGSIVLLFHSCNLQYLSMLTLRITSRVALFSFGVIWIQTSGQIPSSSCPSIIVSNHISTLEVLHLITILDSPSFVAKAAVFNIPIIGRLASILGCIGVDRVVTATSTSAATATSPSVSMSKRVILDSTLNATERIMQHSKKAHKLSLQLYPETSTLVIFPEGTTSNGKQLLSFKKGAFVPLQPVLPILYSFPNSGSFIPTYESILTPIYVWRIMSQPWNNLCCCIERPIYPPSARNNIAQPIEIWKETVRSSMAQSLGVKTVNQGYTDKLKYHELLRTKFNKHPRGAFYAGTFEPKYNIDDDDQDEKKKEK